MTAQGDGREPLGKPEQDMASGSVWLPSARRRSSDPCSHSRETPSLAGTVETDGCLDNEQTHSDWLVLQGRGWRQLRCGAVRTGAVDHLIFVYFTLFKLGLFILVITCLQRSSGHTS